MKTFYVVAAILAITSATDVSVSNFKVAILAKDQQPSIETLTSVPEFSKLPKVLNVDVSERLFISFDILRKSDKSKAQPQQVFIRLESEIHEDATLVVNPDNNGIYTFDSDLRTSLKAFRNLDVKIRVYLVVGDVTVKNPINWNFADLVVNASVPSETVPKSQQVHYEKQEDIFHIFRQPESRPSAFISDLFTAICLCPLVLLIGLWTRVGINFGSVPQSLWVPIFHIGLTGIFGLYFSFWVKLDMFETLKFLAIFGFLTFVAGNRVLRALAREKIKSD